MSQREPIFNVPRIVVWLLAAFFAVHGLRQLLPHYQTGWSPVVMEYLGSSPWLARLADHLPNDMLLTRVLAFIPARLDGLAADLPGGYVAAVTQFGTHIFLHGDITHLVVNSAWFLAFASAIARRTDTLRFLAFFLLAGSAGALLFSLLNRFELTMLIGASGAISGLMGAAFRFIFGHNEAGMQLGDAASKAPLVSLADTLRDRRVVTAIVGWSVLNVLFAWGAGAALTEAAGIAWEAHIGGFAAGLLTYGFFDAQPAVHPDGGNAAGAG